MANTVLELKTELADFVQDMQAAGKSRSEIMAEGTNKIYDYFDERFERANEKHNSSLLTIDECLEELIDEMGDEGKHFLTPFAIGKKLAKNKLNNEANIKWMRQQCAELGVEVRVR